jgi:hypothetical protein
MKDNKTTGNPKKIYPLTRIASRKFISYFAV